MNKIAKAIVMILVILGMIVLEYFTMDYIKNNQSSSSSNSQVSSENSKGNAEEEDFSGEGGEDQGMMGTMSEKEFSEELFGQESESSSSSLDIIYYVIFALENLVIAAALLYLIMSSMCQKTFKEVFPCEDKVWIYCLSSSVLCIGLTFLSNYLVKRYFLNFSSELTLQNSSSNASVEAVGAYTVDGVEETLDGEYSSSNSDESVILVKNGGDASLNGATITKTGGDSSNTENSEFYGINAGILVTEGSKATIYNCTISTNAKGSNAVFATGEDAKIYIKDSKITTTGSSSSRGLDATYGGYIEADNVVIKTQGGSCAALATDRGEGTVIARNSDLETNGSGSPVIYSTGDISIFDTVGVANGSQMVVIEGKNSATVQNSTLSCSGKGNRNDVDNCGIMIYQSMSGDADEGTGTFKGVDSTLEISSSSSYYKTAPFFFVTNTDAIINLENCIMKYGSNLLLKIQGTSEWGTSGSNGGNVTLNAHSQSLAGDIEVDSVSTLAINIEEDTEFSGAINNSNTAKSVTLCMDASSKLVLTGDSYLTSFTNEDQSNSNIEFGNYKLYVNGVAIN